MATRAHEFAWIQGLAAFYDVHEQNFDERVVAVEHAPRPNFAPTIGWIAASFGLPSALGQSGQPR